MGSASTSWTRWRRPRLPRTCPPAPLSGRSWTPRPRGRLTNADPKKRGPQPEPLPRPGNGSGHAVANPSKPEDSGEATRRTRTIKPMALTIEQLDAFMSRDFKDG